jgi:hypothetical protein
MIKGEGEKEKEGRQNGEEGAERRLEKGEWRDILYETCEVG